jgi:hypothetical protein
MAMDPVLLHPLSDCAANYRPVLSSEWGPNMKKKEIVKQRKLKFGYGHRRGPTSRRTGRPTAGRNITGTGYKIEINILKIL